MPRTYTDYIPPIIIANLFAQVLTIACKCSVFAIALGVLSSIFTLSMLSPALADMLLFKSKSVPDICCHVAIYIIWSAKSHCCRGIPFPQNLSRHCHNHQGMQNAPADHLPHSILGLVCCSKIGWWERMQRKLHYCHAGVPRRLQYKFRHRKIGRSRMFRHRR